MVWTKKMVQTSDWAVHSPVTTIWSITVSDPIIISALGINPLGLCPLGGVNIVPTTWNKVIVPTTSWTKKSVNITSWTDMS